MLCGCYDLHSPQLQYHCCLCTVTYDSFDNSKAICQYLSASKMMQIVQSSDKIHRIVYGQYQVINVFASVPMADPQHGIFRATPVERRHD